MELEQQVVSLELAKKLKELGVEQESYWKWSADGELTRLESEVKHPDSCAAFTVAELGDIVPHRIEHQWSLHVLRTSEAWDVYYLDTEDTVLNSVAFAEPSIADAFARMLIYLIENDLYKA